MLICRQIETTSENGSTTPKDSRHRRRRFLSTYSAHDKGHNRIGSRFIKARIGFEDEFIVLLLGGLEHSSNFVHGGVGGDGQSTITVIYYEWWNRERE